LPSGLVYGFRAAPFGIRACLSTDGGRSWQPDDAQRFEIDASFKVVLTLFKLRPMRDGRAQDQEHGEPHQQRSGGVVFPARDCPRGVHPRSGRRRSEELFIGPGKTLRLLVLVPAYRIRLSRESSSTRTIQLIQ
jgi:hypothetical protein